METLTFKMPPDLMAMEEGREYVTVRRGVKWALRVKSGDVVNYRGEGPLLNPMGRLIITNVQVIRFSDIDISQLEKWHRFIERPMTFDALNQLYRALTECYENFSQEEIVTILTFTVSLEQP